MAIRNFNDGIYDNLFSLVLTGETGSFGPTGPTGPMGSGFISIYSYGAVGNGIADDTTALVNALNAQSGSTACSTVLIPNGTFNINSTVTLPNGTNLKGSGGKLKIGNGSSQNILLRANSGSTVVVDGVIFDATNLMNGEVIYGDFGTNVTIKNCQFLNIPNTGFPAVQSQATHAMSLDSGIATITGNYIPQSGGDAINCNSGAGYVVSNNVIYNTGDGAIAFNNGASGVIANNIIDQCNLGIGAGPEGNVSDSDPVSHQMIVIGNKISRCNYGINCGWFGYSGRLGPTNFSITGNTIKGSGACGFYYGGNPSALINVQGVVSGNTFVSQGATYSYWSNNLGFSRCIWFQDTLGININSNIFGDPDTSQASVIGVDVQSTSGNITISNNLFTTNSGQMSGIINGGSATNVLIVGNNSQNCGLLNSPSGQNCLITSNNIH